ncbi:polysaccharide deacetylase family protein [Bacillus pinisoli]|uniref:polysaccharide deacetylase family protein n=1 Tax=Bacillus pinisoli TaxID=2901866 RepID=UPI001FF4F12B|nr:polysaccharide deacetylase family protein [Bacillus pinisoli]
MNQIKPSGKKVMLTFDDGPGKHLPLILDILKEKQVKALFFWQSRLLYNGRPWKRVLKDGHLIGSHASNHTNLTSLTKELQYRHIQGSVEKIETITGGQVKYFRPPFGQYNEDTMEILHDLNLTPVMWDLTSYDWNHQENPTCIKTNIISHLQEGSIILLHELKQTTMILPELIDEIRNQGYEFELIS